jgi:hypothetical protein
MIFEAIAGGVLLFSAFGLAFTWRQRRNLRRVSAALRVEMKQSQEDLTQQIALIDGKVIEAMESQHGMQASLELLRDGRLGSPVRSRALKMLRSGLGADAAATELGLPKNEVRLLAKVAAVLASRN